jgi:hypothetical protein
MPKKNDPLAEWKKRMLPTAQAEQGYFYIRLNHGACEHIFVQSELPDTTGRMIHFSLHENFALSVDADEG